MIPKKATEPRVYVDWGNFEVIPKTACKHSKWDCIRCGTSYTRDVVHTTRGGKGVVSRVLGRSDRGSSNG